MGQTISQSLYLGINKRDKEGFTLLHQAVESGNLSRAEELISKGAWINARDYTGHTPLHYALGMDIYVDYVNSLEMSEMLLKNGADLKARSKNNITPLEFLARTGNVEKMKLFQKFNADFHEISETQLGAGRNLLFSAAYHNKSVEAIQFLIDLGLDVNRRNNVDGKKPIHSACRRYDDNLRVVQCFLKNGADINAVDFEGSTPLRETIDNIHFSDESIEYLNFMLEHCCVNSNTNILEQGVRPLRDYVWKTILKHIAKLQILDITVHPLILDSISKEDKFDNFLNQCKKELLLAKNTKFSHSWVSFYNLLVDSRKRLKNYAGNVELIKEFKNSGCVKKFPTYGAKMIENVKKGVARRELFDESILLLSDCLPIFSPTHLVIRDILDCILSKKDLLKFCKQDDCC